MNDRRHGWLLQWFVKDQDDLAGECDITDVTVERLQEVFSEPSPDHMMCLTYPVGTEQADALGSNVAQVIVGAL